MIGIGFHQITWAEYYADPGFNASFLAEVEKSPARAALSKAVIRKPTPAMVLGTATHALALERELFYEDYGVVDESRSTKAGKAAVKQLENQGKTALSRGEWDAAHGMVESLKHNEDTRRYFTDSISRERTMIWKDPDTGERCKARTDLTGIDWIADIKTTSSLWRWGRDLPNRTGQWMQAAWYLRGLEQVMLHEHSAVPPVKTFHYLVVQSDPPHETKVYDLEEDWITVGSVMCDRMMKEWTSTEKKKSEKPRELLMLPAWLWNKVMEGE